MTAHNIGGSAAPATIAQVEDANGEVIGRADVPALEAPLDLQPKAVEVTIRVTGAPQEGWRVVLDPDDVIPEITEVNNTAPVRG